MKPPSEKEKKILEKKAPKQQGLEAFDNVLILEVAQMG